jgi:murein DD-endopeptidase MepM/ murein hydrolase activator NlpD
MPTRPPRLLAAILLAGAAACADRASERVAPAAHSSDIDLPADSTMVPLRVANGATLPSLLAPAHVHAADVAGVIEAISGVFDPRKLRSGQAYRIERTDDGCVRLFEYEVDPEHVLRVWPTGPHVFDAAVEQYESTTVEEIVHARLEGETSSLFAAMEAQGETPELPIALAEIFGGEIDFNTDLRSGDAFHLAVPKTVRDGRLVRYAPIQAAEILNDGRRIVGVRYTPAGGHPGYYDEQGRSLKRFFLRSPLRFEPRITSGFSRARMHPVLHVMRAHLGVDFGAPVGAPVVAIASGVVSGAGWRGGGGRTISIRHARGYESFYLHLSSIGVRPGAHVAQGQVIGRVGQSGLATGPHLDYRLKKNGAFVNPLLEQRRLPPGDPIPDTEREAFSAAREELLQQLRDPAAEDAPTAIAMAETDTATR